MGLDEHQKRVKPTDCWSNVLGLGNVIQNESLGFGTAPFVFVQRSFHLRLHPATSVTLEPLFPPWHELSVLLIQGLFQRLCSYLFFFTNLRVLF